MNIRNFCNLGVTAFVLLLSIGLMPKTAKAITLVDLTVTGEVTDVNNVILATQFSVGQTMSATITYNASTPAGTSPISTQRVYLGAITGGNFTIDSYSGTVFNGNINIENDDPTFDDGITLRGFAMGPAVGSLNPSAFGYIFDDPTQAAINNLALPLTASVYTGFPEQLWGLAFGSGLGTDPPQVTGILTSIQVTVRENVVPEPITATLGLMSLSALGIATRRRAA